MAQAPESRNLLSESRLFVIGLSVVIVVLGLALVIMTIGRREPSPRTQPINALADSTDKCVGCHRDATPGIVAQYGISSMAAAEVGCEACHSVDAKYPDAVEHQGGYVLASPTPARCAQCHSQEVAQFNQSRHALPAYVAYAGSSGLSPAMLAAYMAIPEGSYAPDKSRNALYALEGPEITRFACEVCHGVGLPRADGSVGECQKCHLRHEFSLEQVRKPDTCNACHIGPDHPQFEIYQESPHGIAYATGGETWNWSADAGTLTTEDFPAPTCALCHFSGFGAAGTTHDVGDRLTWYLFAPQSERRPAWQDNQVRMQSVCQECHNTDFVSGFYTDADKQVNAVNAFVQQGDDIVAQLQAAGQLTEAPFDQPIDFVIFELWHHWGRTAKFGAWMQGPDYTQWHGAYEMLSDLADLEQAANSASGSGSGR